MLELPTFEEVEVALDRGDLAEYVWKKGDFGFAVWYTHDTEAVEQYIDAVTTWLVKNYPKRCLWLLLEWLYSEGDDGRGLGIKRRLAALEDFIPRQFFNPFVYYRVNAPGISAGATDSSLWPALRAIVRFALRHYEYYARKEGAVWRVEPSIVAPRDIREALSKEVRA